MERGKGNRELGIGKGETGPALNIVAHRTRRVEGLGPGNETPGAASHVGLVKLMRKKVPCIQQKETHCVGGALSRPEASSQHPKASSWAAVCQRRLSILYVVLELTWFEQDMRLTLPGS